MKAKSWRTVQTFRSSPAASCTLSSSPRLSRRTPADTRVSPPTLTAPIPPRLRSTLKVKPALPHSLSSVMGQVKTPVEVCCFNSSVPAGASSSDSEGEQHFEPVSQ